MTIELTSLLKEKRYEAVESAVTEALLEPVENAAFLLSAFQGLARAGQKSRLQALAASAESVLKGEASNPDLARLRWNLLKEAVKAGSTPPSPGGFHSLLEEALTAVHQGAQNLKSLLGRFKVREAKTPVDGLARLERVERWIPFEIGRIFSMPGRGAGKVVETNFQLDAVRLDFEKASGISVPIAVAAKSLVALTESHFLTAKLRDPVALAAAVEADPPAALRRLLASFPRLLTVTEVKEAFSGLVPDERWSAFWTNVRKHPQVVVHGNGKLATVEWSGSAEEADDKLLTRFEKGSLAEQLDFFRKHGKRSPEMATRLARTLAEEARRLVSTDPAMAFEIANVVEKAVGVELGFEPDDLVPQAPVPFLSRITDRTARERALLSHSRKFPTDAVRVLSEWFLIEEDARTLDLVNRKLEEIDRPQREQLLERLLKSPRQGPRAFYWLALAASEDESLRARFSPATLARLLDALTWPELSTVRARLRELFDRSGLVAQWIVKQASLEEARAFLETLARHHELEPSRVRGLVAAAETRFPELRKKSGLDEEFFVTMEAIEAKRQELERIVKLEIPENTKGLAIAAAEGDLTENFEYKARRDRQQLLSARAGQLQDALTKARPLDPSTVDASEVRPGTRVTVLTPEGERVVTLLGPWDSDPPARIYSYLSELGRALLGKKVGEKAHVFGDEADVTAIEVWR